MRRTNGQGASNPGAPCSPFSPLGPFLPFFPFSPCGHNGLDKTKVSFFCDGKKKMFEKKIAKRGLKGHLPLCSSVNYALCGKSILHDDYKRHVHLLMVSDFSTDVIVMDTWNPKAGLETAWHLQSPSRNSVNSAPCLL